MGGHRKATKSNNLKDFKAYFRPKCNPKNEKNESHI
jgi:hypothetical protein